MRNPLLSLFERGCPSWSHGQDGLGCPRRRGSALLARPLHPIVAPIHPAGLFRAIVGCEGSTREHGRAKPPCANLGRERGRGESMTTGRHTFHVDGSLSVGGGNVTTFRYALPTVSFRCASHAVHTCRRGAAASKQDGHTIAPCPFAPPLSRCHPSGRCGIACSGASTSTTAPHFPHVVRRANTSLLGWAFHLGCGFAASHARMSCVTGFCVA